MQNPKTRVGNLEVPQRTSPVTPRTARQLKTPGSDSDSVSPHPTCRTPKDRSPKVTERRSPRSPVTELQKRRPTKMSELESQISQLKDELKKKNEQLNLSEIRYRNTEIENEDTKKQLVAMTQKFEESQRQLVELSTSEESRLHELRKISQERDKVWESELNSVQKQHSEDSASLASALNEIQKLKMQLEMVSKSEYDGQNLAIELEGTNNFVEILRSELRDCRESEAQSLKIAKQNQEQLEAAKIIVEAYNSLSSELESSKSRVDSLEGLVEKLEADLVESRDRNTVNDKTDVITDSNLYEVELKSLKLEVEELKNALEASETKYYEEQTGSTMRIRNAYELIEQIKSSKSTREFELEAELKKVRSNIEELKLNLMDKETLLQSISEENEELNMKMEENQSSQKQCELEVELEKSKSRFCSALEENEILKSEIEKKEMDCMKYNKEIEAVRTTERDALLKLGHMTEEADNSNKKAMRVTEQLEAVQVTNTEMDAELRKLKVQSDQWRKAAEAAAAVLSVEHNGKLMDRTGSFDANYNPISPYSEDMDDETSPKKKNTTMLKKIGVLWKKGPK